jgi:hypothetical protein
MNLVALAFDPPKTNGIAAVNPIQRTCVDRISIQAGKPNCLCPTGFKAEIWFKAGETAAWHTIQGPDFPGLIEAVNAYVESLPT